MKAIVGLLFTWLLIQTSFAQMHNFQTRNQFCFDVGTNQYKQPQTSITFKTAIHNHVIYSLQLRSFNTLYLISQQQHTLKPQAEFYYHPLFSRLTFLFGLGTSVNFQSQTSSTLRKSNVIEPFISSTLIGSIRCFRYQLPVQLFASDLHSGIRIYPEIAYRYKGNSSLYIRTEFIIDNFSVQNPAELYQQVYIGIQRMF